MSLTRCEDCGGPAKWTIIRGDPYYHCVRLCAGFTQLSLFPADGDFIVSVKPPVDRSLDPLYIDSRVSVSALDEATEATPLSITDHQDDDLPF